MSASTLEKMPSCLSVIWKSKVIRLPLSEDVSIACLLFSTYAYAELDLDKRNPFSRLFIKGEGEDSHKRGTFTNEQLKWGYDKALASGSQIKLLMPLLGETGCRLAEIVGLKLEDIDLENDLIHIRPNSARRLKDEEQPENLTLGWICQAGYGTSTEAGR